MTASIVVLIVAIAVFVYARIERERGAADEVEANKMRGEIESLQKSVATFTELCDEYKKMYKEADAEVERLERDLDIVKKERDSSDFKKRYDAGYQDGYEKGLSKAQKIETSEVENRIREAVSDARYDAYEEGYQDGLSETGKEVFKSGFWHGYYEGYGDSEGGKACRMDWTYIDNEEILDIINKNKPIRPD